MSPSHLLQSYFRHDDNQGLHAGNNFKDDDQWSQTLESRQQKDN